MVSSSRFDSHATSCDSLFFTVFLAVVILVTFVRMSVMLAEVDAGVRLPRGQIGNEMI